LGLPGALPVPNKEAVTKTQKLGLALNCEINKNSRFDRKHYFYPDLPKGYQISQYKQPLCGNGFLKLPTGSTVDIERIHLEEDTAKSFHSGSKTLIDFNKSGMALIEMVTKPTIYTVVDAVEYGQQVQEIVRHLDISDANMELGQLRIEPNISLRSFKRKEEGRLADYKVEIKNINSFKFMEKAIKAEIKRQRDILDSNRTPLQENRGFDEMSGKTVSQRSKEEAQDYRYFPEPDIPPMVFSDDHIKSLEEDSLSLPEEIKQELMDTYDLSRQEVEVLFAEELIDLLEELINLGVDGKEAVNILVNRPEYRKMSPGEIVQSIEEKENKIEDTSQLQNLVIAVIKENPEVVEQIKQGKETAKEYLLGQVMRKTKGKADPVIVRKIINEKL
jgi:aspartyl-tRNA(Asn)/glutamyl-tRNA(Gln) amidotransferase subunit B